MGTDKDNVADMVNKSRQANGERAGSAKLTEEQVIEIRKMRWIKTERELAKKYGVTSTAIHLIHKNRNWKHLNGETRDLS